ncbi:MAG: RecX family transcriptional regulator [Candidatus Omnitrophica bacterium]|nr:RecX family transcriptional regulator [Candidatus Omnitrophota bacterium]
MAVHKADKLNKNEKAKKYALFLLKFSPRTRLEMVRRLEAKGFAADEIKEALNFLESGQYVDDAKFIRLYLGQKIDKPVPFEKIREAILLKGVEESFLEEELKSNPVPAEEERIFNLAQWKLEKTPALQKERLKDYFLRQGFDELDVDRAMERL